ncbi:D-alanine-D-alanine ligase [Dysgonomonadaceae bacterium PH5-43]|nr:D-alanine-D-alanine ligase [Dysgonomonadaceae bacterium PH5-43]
MNKKNIAIVAGGYSSEMVISLKSAQGIYSFIDKERYNCYVVVVTKDKWIVQVDNKEIPVDKNDFSFVENDKIIKFDFAYITIHGTPGENGLLQGYLDMLNVPYSCCGVLTASLTFNKYFCNNYLRGFGLKTAKSICLRKEQQKQMIYVDEILKELGLPVFVKPNDGGSSFATNKVTSADQLIPAINEAFGEGQQVMIESFMKGTEVTCGCFKTKGNFTVLPITEVVSKNEFFDFDAKYNPSSVEEITPARISNDLTKEIQDLTKRVYQILDAKGIIRVDYIISEEGEVSMLEVNTTPGMTTTSFIPQQIKAAGLNIKEVMTEIIENESY